MSLPTHPGSAGEGQGIRVDVCSALGATAGGELLRIDAESVRLRFPSTRAPALCIASAAELRFRTRPDQPPLVVQARVFLRGDDERHREYGFSFLDTELVRKHLLPSVIHSRRSFVRVRPAAGSPIQVVLVSCASHARLTGHLIDVSEGGLALQIRPDDEDAFAEVTQATAEFQLPGMKLLRMTAAIRGRRLVGSSVHLRLCFVSDESKSFEEQRQVIWRYVIQRQLVRSATAG